MNRIDRLYALVEELRAAGPRGRTARQLAGHFEVSVRTVERDLSALGQAGVPLATKQGRTGGYTLDRSMSLPPLNFTSREATAVAVALSRSDHVLFARDARSALQKIVAAMPERALEEARAAAAKVRLLVHPVPRPGRGDRRDDLAGRARQPRAAHPLHRRRRRRDRARGRAAARRRRPQRLLPHRLVPPETATTGCSGWIASPGPSARRPCHAPQRAVPEPKVDGHETKLPESALRPEDLLPNTDIGLSRVSCDGGCSPPPRRVIRTMKETLMTTPAPGTLAWFEVATSDPDGAEKFYGSLFDWTFDADGPAASGGMDYRNIKASGADGPMGGIFGTGGQMPDHAVFYILVADVEATCADAEQLGGSVVSKHLDPGPGAPTFAYLRDPAGNQFGVFTPPAA